MKRRARSILSLVLSLMVVMQFTTVIHADDSSVAAIGDTEYKSLDAAVAAAGEGDTITLLRDVTDGSGIRVESGKSFVLDLAGHTYNIGGGLVSESEENVESLGMYLPAGSAVTIANGALTSTVETPMLIQNFSNLTLTDVVIDTTASANCQFVLSNNAGAVLLNGSTSIVTAGDTVALDACWYQEYPDGTNVTVDTAGSIVGTVMLDPWDEGSTAPAASTMSILNGNFAGSLQVDEGVFQNGENGKNTGISISGGTFTEAPKSAYIAEGFESTETDGIFTVAAAGTEEPEEDAVPEESAEPEEAETSPEAEPSDEVSEPIGEAAETAEAEPEGSEEEAAETAEAAEPEETAEAGEPEETAETAAEPSEDEETVSAEAEAAVSESQPLQLSETIVKERANEAVKAAEEEPKDDADAAEEPKETKEAVSSEKDEEDSAQDEVTEEADEEDEEDDESEYYENAGDDIDEDLEADNDEEDLDADDEEIEDTDDEEDAEEPEIIVDPENEFNIWIKGSGLPLSIRSDADIEDFVEVLVDGEVLDPSNYTVTEGSTIVTLDPEYLESLPDGDYDISIVSTTGEAETQFTIASVESSSIDGGDISITSTGAAVEKEKEKNPDIPDTGDKEELIFWSSLMMTALLGLAAAVSIRRRSRKGYEPQHLAK